MINDFYETLAGLGFHHPLHPLFAHIPIGLVIGMFLFGIWAWIFKRPELSTTARHCGGLAFIFSFPTIILGYFDWQHFFSGTWLFPIKGKVILAGVLIVFLFFSIIGKAYGGKESFKRIVLYIICFVAVAGLGYLGGELVYGKKTPEEKSLTLMEKEGEQLFGQYCNACHHSDRGDVKVGPGLKGLFSSKRLPVSKKPVSEKTVENLIRQPLGSMPSFKDLSDSDMNAILAYLKSL